MKASASCFMWWGRILLGCRLCRGDPAAYINHASARASVRSARPAHFSPDLPTRSKSTRPVSPPLGGHDSWNNRLGSIALRISTVDVEIVPQNDSRIDIDDEDSGRDDGLLQLKDVIPLSIYAAICLIGAVIISTYEDFDVTHTRPNPSTLRLPTAISGTTANPSSFGDRLSFLGAATKGMGWGPSNRGVQISNGDANEAEFFEEWYGTSATTLQWKPSYNEIMLQHRRERIPRWNGLDSAQSSLSDNAGIVVTPSSSKGAVASKEELQRAVLQLYRSLDELDELKAMADDYNWEEIKDRLNPATTAESKYALRTALEYSMDVLKSMPSYYAFNPDANSNLKEAPEVIGFDWGSCAWRHCGAKADAQEAVAELYNSVGMLEPFECKFIIDIVERSIRDVLTVVPDDLRPYQNGSPLQVKAYEQYVSQAGNDDEGLGIDYEYAQALSSLRVDLTADE